MANEPYGVPLDDEEDELDDDEEGEDEEESGDLDNGEDEPSDEDSDSERPDEGKDKDQDKDAKKNEEKEKVKDADKEDNLEKLEDEVGKLESEAEGISEAGSLAGGAGAAGGTAAGAAGAGAVEAGGAATVAAFGAPEIIAGILIIIAIAAVFFALFYMFCASDKCMGTSAFPEMIDVANNKTDEQNLKDIQCLNEKITLDLKTSDGPLPVSCAKTIKAWGGRVVKDATAIKSKISDKEPGGTEAIKLLDELIAAAKEAEGIEAGVGVKESREIRDKIVEANKKANANKLITKNRGFSANAQKIVDYVNKTHICQVGKSDCSITDTKVLMETFGVSSGQATAGSNPDGVNNAGAPLQSELDHARNALAEGNIPVWLIRGEAGGEHWIILLKVDSSNNITYYDPNPSAGGGSTGVTGIHVHESTWPGPTGKWQYFFGSPVTGLNGKDKYINTRERGYIFVPPSN